jgi:uncharacterized membrane protein
MRTARLEAFSDGVFAIAITLLVLEIRAPHGPDLWRALGHEWESYVAYLVSFLTIGIIWVNHHGLYDRVARADRTLMFLNLLLLMWVVLIPFPTGLVAEHISGSGAAPAAVVYAGVLLAMGLSFAANWRYAAARGYVQLTAEEMRALTRRNSAGLGFYALAVALGFVAPGVSLAICFAVAAYYVLPDRVPQPRS